jgi:Domain of Unknown Function (DUF1080)
MREITNGADRRAFLASGLKAAAVAAAACVFTRNDVADDESNAAISLFDGKTLDGWIQIQNSETSVGGGDITNLADLAAKITGKSDAVSAFLSDQLDAATRSILSAFVAANSNADPKPVASALAKNLTKIISGASIYDPTRFQNVALRPERQALLSQNPEGRDLARLNRMLLEDAYPADLSKSVSTGWIVKDGAMASTGAGRGVIYTANDYGRFRLIFTMRHVSGNPDHPACVLIFCTRPEAGQIPLDALAGIQFQVPTGGRWDYRPGKNSEGGAEFTVATKSTFDPHEWSRVEILADASTGTARMAVAQPLGSRAVELLDFNDPTAGKIGPIAWQIHNGGLFDEYKDITIEPNPKVDDLITAR